MCFRDHELREKPRFEHQHRRPALKWTSQQLVAASRLPSLFRRCSKRELAFRLERQRYNSTNYEHSNRVATGENREHKLSRPVLP